jgi:hypothetical protein
MNTQQMFDRVVNHMRAQGYPGGTKTRGWTYINPNNPCERCAKGILLQAVKDTDGTYTRNNIDEPLFTAIEFSLDRKLTRPEIELLNSLEYTFEMVPEANWEEQFEIAAIGFDLIYTESTQIAPTNMDCTKSTQPTHFNQTEVL